jgi:YfiR/HmsC-like
MPACDLFRRASIGWRRGAAAVLAAIALYSPVGRAQDVTEPSLKAAFIYNFAKFTEWPQDVLSGTTPFNACVVGDVPIGEALERSVKGRQLGGRSITVQRIAPDGPLKGCHLLYISGVKIAQVASVVEAVKGAPVLTISDVDDFARLGGIAHVFVENGKMRFDLNLELARRARLQLSSKLLVLAARVHDAPAPAQR